jgi:hypothetical protein
MVILITICHNCGTICSCSLIQAIPVASAGCGTLDSGKALKRQFFEKEQEK